MENKMPIDDLFRNGLANGEEPMNESAWTNMERLLDGENPYADEPSRKRRILPWLFGGGLLAVLLVGGWWMQQHKPSSTASSNARVETQTSPVPQTTTAPLSTTTALETTEASTAPQSTPSTQTSNNTSPQLATTATTNTIDNTNSERTQDNRNRSTNNRSSKKNTQTNASVAVVQVTQLPVTTNNNNASSATEANTTPVADAPLAKTSNTTKGSKQKNKPAVLPKTVIDKPVAVTAPLKVNSPLSATTESTAPFAKRSKQITTVELNERVDRSRNGSVMNKGFDTLSISSSEEPSQQALPRWMQPDADGKYHPRYVVMNADQDQQAQQQVALSSKESVPDNAQKAASPAPQTASTKPSTSSQNETARKSSKESSVDRLRTKAAVFNDNMTSKIGKSCPGMSMGVHAAINNPKNNFGGFQFGLNNLKPFGDYFSLLAEVKFFMRNNSGYSIRDIMTVNKNLSVDTIAVPSQTVYAYQVDSMSHLYNFKRFASIELPLVLQFHYRRLTAYAGVNMAYQFRINTSNAQRNFVVNHYDTIPSQLPHNMPAELGQDVTKADFHARWGLGLVGGLSYSFNPQLYVDMRMVRNVSDNAQTLSARDVSANTFKVPSVQLSLGYRFRKFIPQQ
jgi:hypothetical protein